jgi:hypothetical protein
LATASNSAGDFASHSVLFSGASGIPDKPFLTTKMKGSRQLKTRPFLPPSESLQIM